MFPQSSRYKVPRRSPRFWFQITFFSQCFNVILNSLIADIKVIGNILVGWTGAHGFPVIDNEIENFFLPARQCFHFGLGPLVQS